MKKSISFCLLGLLLELRPAFAQERATPDEAQQMAIHAALYLTEHGSEKAFAVEACVT